MHQLEIKVLNIIEARCNHETYPFYLFTPVKALRENTFFREGCHGGRDATHPAIRFFNARNKLALSSHYLISNLKVSECMCWSLVIVCFYPTGVANSPNSFERDATNTHLLILNSRLVMFLSQTSSTP